SDAASFLAAMDVCVLTSQREGFPNAVLEAMALARPVVAAAVGGVPELIEDGVSGLLVSARAPSDFAAAIERCLDDANLARALGERARDRVRAEFAIGRMVNAHCALYDELLARAAGVGPCAASAE
ncbi:MAG: glycosyltransferase family 4 protein, partial [Candidatus Hydrogenedentes bacterium]|nr:glycosyltransferase family 4 protein [Candidatus Hydrogenedentota bacterium]